MFVLLSFCLRWEGGGLAVAQACDVADETAFLVGHTDFDGGNLVMVGDADGLSTKLVALLGTRHIHDAVADADGELALGVHQGCYRQVGQGKQGPALTNVCTIQVRIRHHHLGHRMRGVHFRNPAARIGRKPVCPVQ